MLPGNRVSACKVPSWGAYPRPINGQRWKLSTKLARLMLFERGLGPLFLLPARLERRSNTMDIVRHTIADWTAYSENRFRCGFSRSLMRVTAGCVLWRTSL